MTKLEREYKDTAGAKQFRVRLESVTLNKERLMLVTTCKHLKNFI